ncbi:MAG: glucosaminidase domain-containing protein [Elusimicrobiota bacterium]|jgi:hypothetical protein|nr:glucosaminidase domain-containing protein [Elusimicrobiota bacterium]
MRNIFILTFAFLFCACSGAVNLKTAAQADAAPAAKQATSQPIMGRAVATQQQCIAFLKKNNPNLKVKAGYGELVKIYYEEAAREGIRPDLTFAQSLLETNYFKFGGDVNIKQNNFSGIGAVGGGASGVSFKDVRTGVRAQVQHLKAYASKELPSTKIVDPRFNMVAGNPKLAAAAKTWHDLAGKWAADPKYGDKIILIYNKLLKE